MRQGQQRPCFFHLIQDASENPGVKPKSKDLNRNSPRAEALRQRLKTKGHSEFAMAFNNLMQKLFPDDAPLRDWFRS
jgi:hypothetical protein